MSVGKWSIGLVLGYWDTDRVLHPSMGLSLENKLLLTPKKSFKIRRWEFFNLKFKETIRKAKHQLLICTVNYLYQLEHVQNFMKPCKYYWSQLLICIRVREFITLIYKPMRKDFKQLIKYFLCLTLTRFITHANVAMLKIYILYCTHIVFRLLNRVKTNWRTWDFEISKDSQPFSTHAHRC